MHKIKFLPLAWSPPFWRRTSIRDPSCTQNNARPVVPSSEHRHKLRQRKWLRLKNLFLNKKGEYKLDFFRNTCDFLRKALKDSPLGTMIPHPHFTARPLSLDYVLTWAALLIQALLLSSHPQEGSLSTEAQTFVWYLTKTHFWQFCNSTPKKWYKTQKRGFSCNSVSMNPAWIQNSPLLTRRAFRRPSIHSLITIIWCAALRCTFNFYFSLNFSPFKLLFSEIRGKTCTKRGSIIHVFTDKSVFVFWIHRLSQCEKIT